MNGSTWGDARANIVLLEPDGSIAGTATAIHGSTTIQFGKMEFTYGTPLYLGFQFYVTVGGSGVTSFIGGGTYGDTITLTGLTVTNADGMVIPDATFASDSGVQYSAGGVVPEPSTTVLFFAWLCAVAGLGRLRR